VREPATGKGRFDLLSPESILALAQHFEVGANKYADRNWEHGIPLSRFTDSALRHTFQFMDGAGGEDHLLAAAWNLMAAWATRDRIQKGRLPRKLADIPAHTRKDNPIP
jgi:hypothetical protein